MPISSSLAAALNRTAIAIGMTMITVVMLASARSSNTHTSQTEAQDAPNLSPRTVLITGANRGLGLEFARQYREAGWNVIGTARDAADADELQALGDRIRVETLDVADQKSVDDLASRLKDQPIDLLINNAGISGAGNRLEDVKVENYVRVFEVNAVGPMRVTQALLPNLRAGTGKIIVSISSGLGSITGNTRGGNYAYRESKAALNMFMRTLAAELRDDGFVCIPMSPGWVQTDMGGPNAQLTPAQSIAGMKKVIDGLKAEDSGKFLNHLGDVVPW